MEFNNILYTFGFKRKSNEIKNKASTSIHFHLISSKSLLCNIIPSSKLNYPLAVFVCVCVCVFPYKKSERKKNRKNDKKVYSWHMFFINLPMKANPYVAIHCTFPHRAHLLAYTLSERNRENQREPFAITSMISMCNGKIYALHSHKS